MCEVVRDIGYVAKDQAEREEIGFTADACQVDCRIHAQSPHISQGVDGPGVFPPSVYKFGVASLPIGLLTVSSDTLGEKDIRDLAYFTVRPQMASIPWHLDAAGIGGEGPTDHGVPRSTTYVGVVSSL